MTPGTGRSSPPVSANYVLGVACGNLAIGLSYGWWVSKHNRHHAHPNTEDEDPDIMIGVLAFSGGRAQAAAGLRRIIFRYQAWLLVPMLLPRGCPCTRRASGPCPGAGRPGRSAAGRLRPRCWPCTSRPT